MRIDPAILGRLHHDRSGLASIEFVLAAPVILLLVFFVIHANRLSTQKIDTMREMRNAAFAQADGLLCTTDFSKALPTPKLPQPGAKNSLSCSTKPSTEGGGQPSRTNIWEDMNLIARREEASHDLAGQLADEKPNLVTASAERTYSFTGTPKFSWAPAPRPFKWSDRFTVDDTTLFASTKDVTRRGYDPTLRKAIRDVASGAGDLFDGIFPGAR